MPVDALFSGRTAAWLHGLDLVLCDPIEVTLPQRSTCSHLAGVAVTRSDYADDEASEIRGLPVTSPVRTVADLGRRSPFVEAVVAIELGLRARVVDIERICRWAESHPRHRGVGLLRRATEFADPSSESPMETRLRVLLVTEGLPRPVVQSSLYSDTGGFIARPDLLYPEARLALEYDGATHRTSLVTDNRRQNGLIEAGYRVLRFTAGDINHRPASVVAVVRRALYSRGSPN